jgi:hypothetical protein
MSDNNMTRTPSPVVDNWYHYGEKAQKFLVTAIDEHTDSVEIQYFDGTLDEFDLSVWYAMDVEPVEAPEDWTGPVDMDDLSNGESARYLEKIRRALRRRLLNLTELQFITGCQS